MNEKYSGLIFAIASPFFSSIATILKSGATKLLHPLIVSSIGGLLGSVILLAFILLSKEKIDLDKIKSNLKNLTLMTILRPLVGVTVFAYGLSMTEGIKAIFFTKAEPYFVLLWHWLLLREKIHSKHLILLTFHIMGAVILSTGGVLKLGGAQIGDLLVILAMGFFSLSYFFGSKLSNQLGPRIPNAVTMGTAGLILLPFVFVLTPITKLGTETIGWTYLVSYVILFNVIGLTLWFASLKTVKGWIVSALRSLGPIFGAPFAWLLFGETLSIIQIIGGLMILITSALIARVHLAKQKSK